jgi:hypothetical protein
MARIRARLPRRRTDRIRRSTAWQLVSSSNVPVATVVIARLSVRQPGLADHLIDGPVLRFAGRRASEPSQTMFVERSPADRPSMADRPGRPTGPSAASRRWPALFALSFPCSLDDSVCRCWTERRAVGADRAPAHGLPYPSPRRRGVLRCPRRLLVRRLTASTSRVS